ncbi:MAG: 2-oxoglutarate dehydrogenase component, partial [Steroidobacteraceae bacterium]|nr:2-oxoglutarate dehydrogenase component [Steroidobacteraceae bacterium]
MTAWSGIILLAMSESLRELYESSPFSSAQAPYVEALHEQFLADPGSLTAEWRKFFEGLGATSGKATLIAARPAVVTPARPRDPPVKTIPPNAAGGADAEKQSAVSRLIQFHANRG